MDKPVNEKGNNSEPENNEEQEVDTLLVDARSALRITSDKLDSEISDIIEAAKLDLLIAGVNIDKGVEGEIDPLIKRAIIIYTKAQFGYDNPDAERMQKSYESLKQHLSLAGDYNAGDYNVVE